MYMVNEINGKVKYAHKLKEGYRPLKEHEITSTLRANKYCETLIYCLCNDSQVTNKHYYIIKGDQHGYKCCYCGKETLGPNPDDFQAQFAKELREAQEPKEEKAVHIQDRWFRQR